MSIKSTDSGAEGTLARQGGHMVAHASEQQASMYKVAYDESVRALEDQVNELSGIRQRLVQYLAFVGAATAFLVGSSLHAADRDAWFFGLAITGTVLLVVSIVCTIVLLWPGISKLAATASAKLIIELNIERNISPVQNEGELYRALAFYNDDEYEGNQAVLRKTRGLYFTAVIFGVLQLATWIVLIWLRA